MERVTNTKMCVGKKLKAIFAMALLCAMFLCGNASAASLVVLDLAEIVDQTAPSVVEVFTETKQVSSWFQEYVTEGAGSGVILTEDGYIVTNRHVVDGAGTVKVRLNNGQAYSATVTGKDAKTDLAVLKIDAEGLTAARLADSSKARVGDFVIAIGNPLGELGGTVTNGIISALGREITIDGQAMTLLQTSVAVNPGNSGGGLFNLDGELVGIVSAKSSGSGIEGLAFAIPSNTVGEIAGELMENGYVTGRSQLGVSVARLTRPGESVYFDQPGVYVAQVTRENGLAVGDRLLRIGGDAIQSASDISSVLDRHSAGDTVEVELVRSGRQIALNVTLAEKGPE